VFRCWNSVVLVVLFYTRPLNMLHADRKLLLGRFVGKQQLAPTLGCLATASFGKAETILYHQRATPRSLDLFSCFTRKSTFNRHQTVERILKPNYKSLLEFFVRINAESIEIVFITITWSSLLLVMPYFCNLTINRCAAVLLTPNLKDICLSVHHYSLNKFFWAYFSA